jgi:hypothetical protein
MLSLRVSAVCAALVALPASVVAENDKVSKLENVDVSNGADDIVVVIAGTRAPDFTSFTMAQPFRVVVDWAGSKVGGKVDQRFDRGLVRSVQVKQFDSEAEQISRITIELAQETAYHVEANGTRVSVHFEPVADPIPEPKVEPAAEEKEAPKDLAYVPEGPLTEPDLPVPENPPAPRVEVAKAPAPAAKPVDVPPLVVAKAEPIVTAVKPAPVAPVVAKIEPKPEPVVVPKVEPKPAPPVVAKVEPAAPKAEPAKTDEIELASYVPKKAEEPVRMAQPAPRPVEIAPSPKTQQLASGAPRDLSTGWQPPGAGKVRHLPVVKIAGPQDTLRPSGETPLDPDDEGGTTTKASDGDFDPGPRVMKYIGFRQMADTSRVFVRLDGKAKYKEIKSEGAFILELINTSVPVKNNRRPLDTSYFSSPVTNVQAVPDGDNTRIEVKLKENIPYTVKRIGTTIAIDFARR